MPKATSPKQIVEATSGRPEAARGAKLSSANIKASGADRQPPCGGCLVQSDLERRDGA
jgi:hypothetical protein